MSQRELEEVEKGRWDTGEMGKGDGKGDARREVRNEKKEEKG